MTVIAADYPFLDILWTLLIFFAWVVWIWVMIVILTDVFRRRDISGWVKAAWVVLLVILPWLGALVYLISNHDGMAERSQKQAEAAQGQFDQYVRQVADKAGPAGEIDSAKKLLDDGTITREEFEQLKAKALTAAPAR
jgi:phospholipase D-like protein/putative oligomerization/nucleic acid binding protein